MKSKTRTDEEGHPADGRTRRNHRVRVAGFAGLVLVLLVGLAWAALDSLYPTDHGLGVVKMDKINIDQVYAVTYLQADTYSLLPPNKSGYLAFIYPDGTYNLVKTEGIDNTLVSWTDKGLFISDNGTATWFKPDGTTQATRKPTPGTRSQFRQYAYAPLSDGIRHVSLNDGDSTDNGRRGQDIVYLDKTGGIGRQTIERQTFVAASSEPSLSACGDSAYVFDMPETNSDDSRTPDRTRISSLVKAGSFQAATIKEVENPLSQTSIATQSPLPCSGGKIIFLANEGGNADQVGKMSKLGLSQKAIQTLTKGKKGDDYVSLVALEQWDPRTGERKVIPLTTEDGQPVAPREGERTVMDSTGLSLQGRTMYWRYKDGSLMATDTGDGRTRTITRDQKLNDLNSINSLTTFNDGYAHTWWLSPDKSGDKADAGHVELARINLSTGRKDKVLPVSGLGRNVSGRQAFSFFIAKDMIMNPKADSMKIGPDATTQHEVNPMRTTDWICIIGALVALALGIWIAFQPVTSRRLVGALSGIIGLMGLLTAFSIIPVYGGVLGAVSGLLALAAGFMPDRSHPDRDRVEVTGGGAGTGPAAADTPGSAQEQL